MAQMFEEQHDKNCAKNVWKKYHTARLREFNPMITFNVLNYLLVNLSPLQVPVKFFSITVQARLL